VRAVFAALLAGCGFQHGEVTSEPKDAPADLPVIHDAPGDAALIDAPPPLCAITDPSLVLCLEFDETGLAGLGTALDGSGKHHDATIANIGIVRRNVPAPSQALALSSTSKIAIATSTDFDIQHFTLSAWVMRDATAEMGVFDVGKQYTMSISSSNGEVECAVSHATSTTGFTAGSTTNQNEWDLVACTYDGTNFCSYSFRGGDTDGQQACINYNMTIDTNVRMGESVGEWVGGTSHLTGGIDQVRVYNRALDEHDLCVNGGLSGC
jgi:hypothetical protein